MLHEDMMSTPMRLAVEAAGCILLVRYHGKAATTLTPRCMAGFFGEQSTAEMNDVHRRVFVV